MMKSVESYLTPHLSERFGCSPEAAITAYQIMYAQAVLLVLFGEAELAAVDVDIKDRRLHLVRALRAVLRPTGCGVAAYSSR
jgi:hypothetical protein